MDYFTKLNTEETISRVVHIFGRKYAVFLSITLLAYVLFFAASVLMIFIFAPFVDYSHQAGDWSSPHYVVATLINNFVYFAAMSIADGSIIRAVTEMYVGQVPTLDTTMQYGLSKIVQLFCNASVIALGVGVPAILVLLFLVWISGGAQVMVLLFVCCFFVVAYYVVVVTYHTYPVIMVEDGGIIDSIYRSKDLSEGHRCHIFTLIVLFGITKFILYTVCNLVATMGGPLEIIFQILHLCISIIFASLSSILQAVVYISTRVDKEGLSHQVLVTELFGPVEDDGKTPYVAASTAEEGMIATPGTAPPPPTSQQAPPPPAPSEAGTTAAVAPVAPPASTTGSDPPITDSQAMV